MMTDQHVSPGAARTARKRQRVTLVLHEFDRGGSGRVAAYLARGFADRGMDVDLVVFRQGGEVEALLVALMGTDIPVRYLGKKRRSRAIDLVRGLPGLVRHLRERDSDVIVAMANNTAWVTAAARSLAGLIFARLYLKTTNPIATSRHKGLIKAIRRWGYRKVFAGASGVWTLSPDESEEMRVAFPETAALFADVINPYVTPAMLALPAPDSAAPAYRTILGVGRLTAQKRFERLIEAFALLTEPDLPDHIGRRRGARDPDGAGHAARPVRPGQPPRLRDQRRRSLSRCQRVRAAIGL
jgi:glycosyltransferase involved in cell wall biosynthesis